MSATDPVVLKSGARLRSTACTTEVMVVQAPAAAVALTCGGAPLAPLGTPVPAPAEGTVPVTGGGTQIGKRYVSAAGDLELLCTKPGAGTLAADGAPLAIKTARPLPSSD